MKELVSFGNNRSYEDFKKQISPNVQPILDDLRDFCLSLDKNVVEDIRMHRIVFGKSIIFRWFADIEPQQDSIIIKMQENRKVQQIIEVKSNEKLEEVKEKIQNAFKILH